MNSHIDNCVEIQKELFTVLKYKFNSLKNTNTDLQYNIAYDLSDNDMMTMMKEYLLNN